MAKQTFKDRVDYAARIIAAGGDTSCNRAFHGCFEMYDGDAVAVALYRKAQANPDGRLAANIWRKLARDTVEPVALANAHRTDLAAWSDELIRRCADS